MRKELWIQVYWPCWSGEALCDTRAETAGKVMEDMAATVPAAHIILNRTHTNRQRDAVNFISEKTEKYNNFTAGKDCKTILNI